MSNVYFSKNNLTNITITLIHTFVYMFSFAVTIPTNLHYLKQINKDIYYSAMVNLCLPAGVLLSFSYSTIWSSKKTKSSIIFSTILLLIGNVIYSLSQKFTNVNFMFIGRFLLGLGCNRVSNKMYIVNYTPKAIFKPLSLLFSYPNRSRHNHWFSYQYPFPSQAIRLRFI